MDGYPGYPGGPGGYPPPGSTPDYNAPPMQRPPSQNTAQSPHPGKILKTKFFFSLFCFLVFGFLFLIKAENTMELAKISTNFFLFVKGRDRRWAYIIC